MTTSPSAIASQTPSPLTFRRGLGEALLIGALAACAHVSAELLLLVWTGIRIGPADQVTWFPGASTGAGRLVFARGAHRDTAAVVICSAGTQGYIVPLDEHAPPIIAGDVVMKESE